MSDIGISPEDRERLAKTKFGEWFDEFWDKKFSEEFDKRVTQTHEAAGTQPTPSERATTSIGHSSAPRQRRRSLLEECFSQTFGMS